MSEDLRCPLNLPNALLTVRPRQTDGSWEIYDPIRRKWVALTPEERVRQTFVSYLIEICGHSVHRIANEVSFKLNRTSRRADTVIYDDTLRPFVIVEYKAPSIPLSAKVLEQALRYNLVLKVPFIIVTNGLKTLTIHTPNPSGSDMALVTGHPTPETLAAMIAKKHQTKNNSE